MVQDLNIYLLDAVEFVTAHSADRVAVYRSSGILSMTPG
jgi:hypothetical protein